MCGSIGWQQGSDENKYNKNKIYYDGVIIELLLLLYYNQWG